MESDGTRDTVREILAALASEAWEQGHANDHENKTPPISLDTYRDRILAALAEPSQACVEAAAREYDCTQERIDSLSRCPHAEADEDVMCARCYGKWRMYAALRTALRVQMGVK